MARLFISHSSRNNDWAIAVRDWLAKNGWDDVFLDLDSERGIVMGARWKEALQKAAYRCEVVIALVSKEWLASAWCKSEVDAARLMGKKVIAALVGVDKSAVPIDLADEQFIDLTGDPDAYRRLKEGLRRAGVDPMSFPFQAGRRPYPGFAWLEEEDAAVFFGRDAQITRGLDEIRRLTRTGVTRIFVILGASRSGKSSFLRAGLWPRLKRDDLAWLPLPIVRPERAAMSGKYGLVEALYQAISEPRFTEGIRERGLPRSRGDIQDFAEKTDDGLAMILAALREIAQADGPSGDYTAPLTTLIAVDQGEELFNVEGRNEASRFIEILAKTLAADPRTLLLLVTRSDSFPLVQSEPKLARLPKDTFTLDMMLEGSYRAVIEGPAQLVEPPLKIDPLLTDALLEDVSGQDALPLLAFTLAHLYDNYRADNELTLSSYVKIGRVKGVIDKTVAQAFAEAVARGEAPEDAKAQLALARSAFVPHLAKLNLAPRFVRRMAPLDMIPPQARPLIDRFVEQRLLVKDRSHDVEVIEVAHDALLSLPPFSDWLGEDSEFILWRDRLSQARIAFEDDQRGLLAGPELETARHWKVARVEGEIEPADLAFIRASMAADDQRRAKETEQARKLQVAERSPRYYVSYAWADARDPRRENQVDQLCQALKTQGIEVIRDKDKLRRGDRISKFMRAIGEGDMVFVFLSDKYLRSPYCMFELFQMWQDVKGSELDFLQKVQIYSMDNAKIEIPSDWLEYVSYWKTERDKLRQKIDAVGWQDAGEETQRRFKYMDTFASNIADILALFSDTVQAQSFDDFLDDCLSDKRAK